MKKVLFIAAAVSLIAAPAFAGITGTKHDLSSANNASSTINEVCVFCHTPHGADTTVANAPLWNRTTVNATNEYNGLDLQATITVGQINSTDAPLCLSCHDGATNLDALNNPPNTGGAFAEAVTNANAVLGADLSDDHPVGFDYNAVQLADGEINDIAAATSVGAIKFFNGSTAANEMWCSSCHDVHNNTEAPFLNTTNSNSTLCLACHAK